MLQYWMDAYEGTFTRKWVKRDVLAISQFYCLKVRSKVLTR